MHPAAGTSYEIVGPLEAFNTLIDGKGKELSIIGRQWKIVIQGRNSKVFIDLRVDRPKGMKALRSVGSAAWHTTLEILDAFVVRWLGPTKARYKSVGVGSAG
ncbi:hypothetical protein V6N13_147626 [Hibiscus sabdariffa]